MSVNIWLEREQLKPYINSFFFISYTLELSHIFSFICLPKPSSSPESSDPTAAHDQTSLRNTKAKQRFTAQTPT